MRSNMAKTLLANIQHQQEHAKSDHSYWYNVDTSEMSEDLKQTFLRLHQDNATVQFLENCYEKSGWLFTQIYHGFMKNFILPWFMTPTSVNAWLDRGSMFVFSREHFLKLIDKGDEWKGDTMLDLGAGDGKVTAVMVSSFHDVHVTEVSPMMVQRLREKNYTVLDITEWESTNKQYDLVSCLNLLDRCDKPISMLHSIKKILKPGGYLLLALVFPIKQYVESKDSHFPSENFFVMVNESIEEQISQFVKGTLNKVGFEVVKWSRLPYLCEGDLMYSFYYLNDILFVLTPSSQCEANLNNDC